MRSLPFQSGQENSNLHPHLESQIPSKSDTDTNTGSPTTKRPTHRSSDNRKQDSPPSFVSTTTTTSDAVPHYLLLAAGSLLFALLGLFGLWLGCFYLSGGGGGAGAGGFGRRAGRGKSGRLGVDEEEDDDDSLCTEEGSVVTLPSPHVMTMLKK